jgi:hypothetical protein
MGWMSKVAVNFDETYEDTWEGSSDFIIKATVTNNGAKPQVYDLTQQFNTAEWDLIATHDYDNHKINSPWIMSLDKTGYPSKIRLGANQSEDIIFKMRIRNSNAPRYNFTLKASESGAVQTRDVDEYTFTLNNTRIKAPEMSMNYSGSNTGVHKQVNVHLSTDNLGLNDTRPINYEITLKIKKGGSFIDPETLSSRAETDNSGNVPAFENISFDYSFDAKNTSFIKITVTNAKFSSLDQKLKMIISLDRLQGNMSYDIVGKVQAFDPITRQRLAFSKETSFRIK